MLKIERVISVEAMAADLNNKIIVIFIIRIYLNVSGSLFKGSRTSLNRYGYTPISKNAFLKKRPSQKTLFLKNAYLRKRPSQNNAYLKKRPSQKTPILK